MTDAERLDKLETTIAYQDQAIELLSQAMTMLPDEQSAMFWREQVQKDIAFLSIHGVTAYGSLDRQFPTLPTDEEKGSSKQREATILRTTPH